MPTCTAPRLPPPASTNAVKFFPCCRMASARFRAARRRYRALGDLTDNDALRARRECRSDGSETCPQMRAVTERLLARLAAAAERDPRTACGASKAPVADERERPFDDAGPVCRRHDAQATAYCSADSRRHA